jgi:hypothetical protein
MTLRKTEGTGNWKRTHSIALCGELTVDEALELSWDRQRNEWFPPEANLVTRRIETTLFSGDVKPNYYSAQCKNQNDCEWLTYSIINVACNKLILWVMGRVYFTEKCTEPKQFFCRTKKSSIKSLKFVLLPLKFVKFETCYIKHILRKLWGIKLLLDLYSRLEIYVLFLWSFVIM